MGKQISQHVTWVGKTDWQLTKFHGDELSTHRGSSYNSYLVRDKKVALIDTVWQPFDKEFVERLKDEIDLSKIGYIIMNHNEIDHSGALPELMRHIPDTPIYCTKNGENIMRGHYHQDWNFVNVHTGDTLSLGDTTLMFIEAPMLHWPDTMFTYLKGDNILFSNDGFGQHLASESLFNDTVDEGIIMAEAEKYYANILAPFNPMVKKKIAELLGLGLEIDMIAPSHGVIWKDNPEKIIGMYTKWCENYSLNQITIVYDTMWSSTRRMAECIAEGIGEADPAVTVKLFNAAHHDKNDILTEVFHSKAVLVGCPTINTGVSYAIAGLLEMVHGLKLKGKKSAAFGSYGWAPTGTKVIQAHLEDAGIPAVLPPLNMNWVPDNNSLESCRQYGRDFVKAL